MWFAAISAIFALVILFAYPLSEFFSEKKKAKTCGIAYCVRENRNTPQLEPNNSRLTQICFLANGAALLTLLTISWEVIVLLREEDDPALRNLLIDLLETAAAFFNAGLVFAMLSVFSGYISVWLFHKVEFFEELGQSAPTRYLRSSHVLWGVHSWSKATALAAIYFSVTAFMVGGYVTAQTFISWATTT